ncbi:ABC transporter ATP-binding protein [Cetobacterium sp. SF1]|uniref:ABC transporter ATP-binding protein n=1 Tax=Cetobacterium sp. SF1 TaxID=3417654 RepID=UPI003CF6FB5C
MIKIENLNKKYKDFEIKNLNIEIFKGEFVSILGESGSGKSTLLNLISGIDEEYKGKIIKDGEISMVFQDSLLLPHLNIFENIAFGLKIKKISKKEIEERVKEVSIFLEIDNLLERYPQELSGGQKQRVAIGRALIMKPDILLLDEPFSALDTNLREKMQELIKNIHRREKITIIFVTHDINEAFYLSEKVAILNKGSLEQYDRPEKIYRNPKNIYVSKFLGIDNIFKRKEFLEIFENIEISENIVYIGIPEETLKISKTEGKVKGKIKELVFKKGFYSYKVEIKNNIEIWGKENRIRDFLKENDEIYISYEKKDLIFIGEEKKC